MISFYTDIKTQPTPHVTAIKQKVCPDLTATPPPGGSGGGVVQAEEKTALMFFITVKERGDGAYFSFTLLAISISFGLSPIMVHMTA